MPNISVKRTSEPAHGNAAGRTQPAAIDTMAADLDLTLAPFRLSDDTSLERVHPDGRAKMDTADRRCHFI